MYFGVIDTLHYNTSWRCKDLADGSINDLDRVHELIASWIDDAYRTTAQAQEHVDVNLAGVWDSKITGCEMFLRRSEQWLLLWEVPFLILESEIRCHLPEMVASLTDSNEFESITQVVVPSAVNQVHGQLALTQYVLMPVEVVPDGNSGDGLSPAQYQQQVRVLIEFTRDNFFIVDGYLVQFF